MALITYREKQSFEYKSYGCHQILLIVQLDHQLIDRISVATFRDQLIAQLIKCQYQGPDLIVIKYNLLKFAAAYVTQSLFL